MDTRTPHLSHPRSIQHALLLVRMRDLRARSGATLERAAEACAHARRLATRGSEHWIALNRDH
jgi:hypothetical protein